MATAKFKGPLNLRTGGKQEYIMQFLCLYGAQHIFMCLSKSGSCDRVRSVFILAYIDHTLPSHKAWQIMPNWHPYISYQQAKSDGMSVKMNYTPQKKLFV